MKRADITNHYKAQIEDAGDAFLWRAIRGELKAVRPALTKQVREVIEGMACEELVKRGHTLPHFTKHFLPF